MGQKKKKKKEEEEKKKAEVGLEFAFRWKVFNLCEVYTLHKLSEVVKINHTWT
jgi:hypothetical protein